MSKFRDKIAASGVNNYEMSAVGGNPALMLELHAWALEQRATGKHMAIFFTDGVLTVHEPRDD